MSAVSAQANISIQPEAAAPNKSVLETILEWSADRPAWQRDALRRIVQKGKLVDGDIADLAALCKEEVEFGVAKAQALNKSHIPANPGAAGSVVLAEIRDARGVNNLAPSQTLSFGATGMTIVYGDNGAGKSGYVRILKRACRARHPGEILSNIYASPPVASPSATVCFSIGGVNQAPVTWKDDGRPHRVLSAISVFDRDCAPVHIDGKNEVAFRPFGLDIPDELAGTCQRVRDILSNEQKVLEKSRNTIFLSPTWRPFTAVGNALAALRPDTDLAALQKLASLSDQEKSRLLQLREDLSTDSTKAVAQQRLKADKLRNLRETLSALERVTSETALKKIVDLHRDASAKREAARLAAEAAFSGDPLPGVGGAAWRSLWESARRYSTEVAYPARAFPVTGSDAYCVLCQQPLVAEGAQRVQRFERFIREDTERQAKSAEDAAALALQTLRARRIHGVDLRANLQELRLGDRSLARSTLRFAASARLRRYALVKAIREDSKDLNLPSYVANPAGDLLKTEQGLQDRAGELQKAVSFEERRKLEEEFAELSDRASLAELIPAIKAEIDRLRSVEFLARCVDGTTTNAITKLGNEIADSVVTPPLRDRFHQEIVKLAAEKVRVEIVRSGGRYGSPQYKVQLLAKPDAKVREILSEGEQTCVALAAFLTELATASHRSGLVFDDPVSSLDHRWRRKVAERLVEEAASRQVIVFTHDLVFVNDLIDEAEDQKRPTHLESLSRGPTGAGVVSTGLPWIGMSVLDRIDKLEKAARSAKALYDDQQEDAYRGEAAQIYGDLRASWERGLVEVAFAKVVLRHRDYIDTKQLKRVVVLTDADCETFKQAFDKCSDIVIAHDPSSGRNADPPPPTEILQDIEKLKNWVVSLRERQKKVK